MLKCIARFRPDEATPVTTTTMEQRVGLAVALCVSLAWPTAAQDIVFINPGERDTSQVGVMGLTSLRFVTVDGFAPFSFFDGEGRMTGVHVDLARAICKSIEVNAGCTIQPMAFGDIENALASGQADAALAGITPTEINRANLAFSVPYARLPARFLENSKAIVGAQGKVATGLVKDGIHAALARTLFPGLELTEFASQEAALAALRSGEVQRVFADGLALGYWAASPAAQNCCKLQPGGYHLTTMKPDELRVAVASSNQDLLGAINAALRDIQISGALDEMMVRHLPFALNQ
jgi:polar amino acid transport system substrate-binding protein